MIVVGLFLFCSVAFIEGNFAVPIDCYNTFDNGASYRGYLSVSINGNKCEYWKNVPLVTQEAIAMEGLDENYCRNPFTVLYESPLCVVTHTGGVWAIEKCDVINCDEVFIETPVATKGSPNSKNSEDSEVESIAKENPIVSAIPVNLTDGNFITKYLTTAFKESTNDINVLKSAGNILETTIASSLVKGKRFPWIKIEARVDCDDEDDSVSDIDKSCTKTDEPMLELLEMSDDFLVLDECSDVDDTETTPASTCSYSAPNLGGSDSIDQLYGCDELFHLQRAAPSEKQTAAYNKMLQNAQARCGCPNEDSTVSVNICD